MIVSAVPGLEIIDSNVSTLANESDCGCPPHSGIAAYNKRLPANQPSGAATNFLAVFG
jgi:hypothetical protein